MMVGLGKEVMPYPWAVPARPALGEWERNLELTVGCLAQMKDSHWKCRV